MSFDLKFGGFTLEGAQEMQGSNPYRVSEHRVPRRTGSVAPRTPVKDSKRVFLTGEIWRDSESDIRTYFDSLNAKLDGGRDRLVIRDDGRFLYAVGQNLDWSFRANSAPALHAFYNLQFIADDPYWYSPTAQEDDQTVGGVNVFTWSVVNGGLARTPPVFELVRTGAGDHIADVTITNTTTGLFMKWTGSFATVGSKLIFDTVNKRVTIAGGNGLKDFSGTFLELEPGTNNLNYAGPGNATIKTTYMERWS